MLQKYRISGILLILVQADTMLSYPIAEAEELLTTRLATAKQNLANCLEDQEFLREQITVRASTGWGCMVESMKCLEQG
jgi:hypothetical protein